MEIDFPAGLDALRRRLFSMFDFDTFARHAAPCSRMSIFNTHVYERVGRSGWKLIAWFFVTLSQLFLEVFSARLTLRNFRPSGFKQFCCFSNPYAVRDSAVSAK